MPIADSAKHVAEITVKGIAAAGGSNAKPTYNVFHFRRTTTASALSKANIATAWEASIGAAMEGALNIDYSATEITIRMIDDGDDMPSSQVVALAGTAAGERLPIHACVTMHLYTALRGQNYRGRKHFSPASEGDTTDDILVGAGLTAWQALRDAILAGFTDSDGNVWVPVVVSASLSQLSVNPTTVIRNDVTSVVLNKNVGSINRRKAATVR